MTSPSTTDSVAALIARLREAGGDKYLVWSNEHRAWWRPDRMGYTPLVSEAGTYTREQAIQICVGAYNGWQSECAPYEVPVRLSDAIECCERVTRTATEQTP